MSCFSLMFRTHNPSRRAAVDLRLRPRGHWERLFERWNKTYENNLKTSFRHLVVHQLSCKRHRILNFFELLDEPNSTRYVCDERCNKYRTTIQLRSIADLRACTTAWSHISWSFDRPVRTGEVIKVPSFGLSSPVSSLPVENWKVWTSPNL